MARTIGKGIVTLAADARPSSSPRSLAAIGWNLFTWYYALPSSSSHALIGGIIGAAVAGSVTHFSVLKIEGILKIVLSLLLSPLAGFAMPTCLFWV